MAMKRTQQDEAVPVAEPAPKAALAKVSRTKSRGREYTQVWLSREVGDRLEKGGPYTADLRKDGVLILRPATADGAS